MEIKITDTWNYYLNFFPIKKRDVYFSEEYVKMTASENEIPLCIVCTEEKKVLIMPFLQKQIGEHLDFETPYGYGGPISNSEDSNWNKYALRELLYYFESNNYIAGFIRFHPLLENAHMCRDIFQVIDDRKTVVIDTSLSEEKIWSCQISSKNRNMIRKAIKNGLVFIRENDFHNIKKFKELYNTTMGRLNASDFYFFDDHYYELFVDSFKGKGFLGCITKDDEIISAALFMYENDYGHYHLAGSAREHSSLGANNLLLWKVACEMHKEGVKEFHLGGGTDGDMENSLFKFKRSFSPNTKQFSIGKIVFNKEAYTKICSQWEKENPDKIEKYKNTLLKYRY